MPFRDNYTNFWFNDISSETMKVWVTNNKDLQFQLTPSFSDTFVAPVAARTRYHTGTTFTSSDIQVKCIAIGVTMQDWRAIQAWLNPLVRGRLHFDFNDKTYYDVKIKQQIKGNVFVAGSAPSLEGDSYNIEFTVDFTTVGDWAALGPQVNVPISGGFNEFTLVTAKTFKYKDYPDYSEQEIALNITYLEFYNSSEDWYDPAWWTEHLAEHPNKTKWATVLADATVASTIIVPMLMETISSHPITTLSSAINNKYWLPCAYNKSAGHNQRLPYFTDAVRITTRSKERVYITEPTIIRDKTIYLDESFFKKMVDASSVEKSFSSYQYFLVDSSLSWKTGFTGEEIDYDQIQNHVVATMQQVTKESGATYVSINSQMHAQDTGMMLSSKVTSDGIALYGVSVLFCASSSDAYAASPFYYEVDGDEIAVLNAGSYEAYPNLYINLGETTNIKIGLNNELLYDYTTSVHRTALFFQGKTGFVTFNNMLAEAATLASSNGNTRVVTNSINNGMMTIPSGSPEIMKIRVFSVLDATVATAGDDIDQLNVTNIFFQPVGKFKYARNGYFGALLYKGVVAEQEYNAGQYPVVNHTYLDSSTYGSQLQDYAFSSNAFITKTKMSNDIDMWVLTIPSNDLTNSLASLKDASISTENHYYYLSLCNYDTLTISSDDSQTAVRYLMMQTRDAF